MLAESSYRRTRKMNPDWLTVKNVAKIDVSDAKTVEKRVKKDVKTGARPAKKTARIDATNDKPTDKTSGKNAKIDAKEHAKKEKNVAKVLAKNAKIDGKARATIDKRDVKTDETVVKNANKIDAWVAMAALVENADLECAVDLAEVDLPDKEADLGSMEINPTVNAAACDQVDLEVRAAIKADPSDKVLVQAVMQKALAIEA